MKRSVIIIFISISLLFGFTIHKNTIPDSTRLTDGTYRKETAVAIKCYGPWGIANYGEDWILSSSRYNVPLRNSDGITYKTPTDLYIHDGIVEIKYQNYDGNNLLYKPYPDCVERYASGIWTITIPIYLLILYRGIYYSYALYKTLFYIPGGSPVGATACESNIHSFLTTLKDVDTFYIYLPYNNALESVKYTPFYSPDTLPGEFLGYKWSNIVNDTSYYIEGNSRIAIKRSIVGGISQYNIDSVIIGDITYPYWENASEPPYFLPINIESQSFDTLFYKTLCIANGYLYRTNAVSVYAWFKPETPTPVKYFIDSLFIRDSDAEQGIFIVDGYKDYVIGYVYKRDSTDSIIPLTNTYNNYYYLGIYKIDTTKTILSFDNDDYTLIKQIYQFRYNGPNGDYQRYNIHPLVTYVSSYTFLHNTLHINSANNPFIFPLISSIYNNIQIYDSLMLFTGPFFKWVILNTNRDTAAYIYNLDASIKRTIFNTGVSAFHYLLTYNKDYSPYVAMKPAMFINNDTINIVYKDFDDVTMCTQFNSSFDSIGSFVIEGAPTDEVDSISTYWKYITTTYPDIRPINERRWRFYLDTINNIFEEWCNPLYLYYYNSSFDQWWGENECCYFPPDTNLPLDTIISRYEINSSTYIEVYPTIIKAYPTILRTNVSDNDENFVDFSSPEAHEQTIEFSPCCGYTYTGSIDDIANYIWGIRNGCRLEIGPYRWRYGGFEWDGRIDTCNVFQYGPELCGDNYVVAGEDNIASIDSSGHLMFVNHNSCFYENHWKAEYVIKNSDLSFLNDTTFFGNGWKIEYKTSGIDAIRILTYNGSITDTSIFYLWIDNIEDTNASYFETPREIGLPDTNSNITQSTDSIVIEFFIASVYCPDDWYAHTYMREEMGIVLNLYMLLSNYHFYTPCKRPAMYADISPIPHNMMTTSSYPMEGELFWNPEYPYINYSNKYSGGGLLQYIPYFDDMFYIDDDPSTCSHKIGVLIASDKINNPSLRYNGNFRKGLFINKFPTIPDTSDTNIINLKSNNESRNEVGW